MTQKTKKTPRQSNIECLRIVAMLMIIMFHITRQCVQPQLSNPFNGELVDPTLFHTPEFFPNLLLIEWILPFGKAGNTVFLMICGYFMGGAAHIDLTKSVKKLFSQVLFATIVLVFGSNIYYKAFPDRYVALRGVRIFNGMFWFVGYYLAVLIIGALCLNRFMQKADKEKHLALLAVLFAVANSGWLGGIFSSLADNLRIVSYGVFVYALGYYIRKYDPFRKIPVPGILGVIAFTYLLIWVSYYNTTMYNIETYTINESTMAFNQLAESYPDYSIVTFVIGLCLFEIARRIKIPNSRVINYLSASTFMTYLLHDDDFMYQIWRERDWILMLYYDPALYFLKLLKWTFTVFFLGVAAYTVYLGCAWLLGKLLTGRAVDETA